jgi:hypothetical protein
MDFSIHLHLCFSGILFPVRALASDPDHNDLHAGYHDIKDHIKPDLDIAGTGCQSYRFGIQFHTISDAKSTTFPRLRLMGTCCSFKHFHRRDI